MARSVTHIVIHCASTSPGWDIGVDEIRGLHCSDKTVDVPWDGRTEKGFDWADVGYHYVIRRSGIVEPGRDEGRVGAHVYGHNRNSIGICLVGGVSSPGGPAEANFTKAQYGALEELVDELLWKYKAAKVLGHRDFEGVSKACPSFNAKEWWNGTTPAENVPIIG